MPVYEYLCDSCGPFEDLRPMAEYQQPQPCPDCGVSVPRAILTAPAFAGMDAGRREAFATNERSANAPKRSSEGRHGSSCSCCTGAKSTSAVASANGAKIFPKKRPWMISH